MYTLAFTIILIIVFLLWCWWKPRHRSPPSYPGALPIIGHSLQLLKHRNDLWSYMEGLADYVLKDNEVAQIQLGPHTVNGLGDPEDIGFVANTCLNKPFFYQFLSNGIGNGLITSDADTWKVHRKLINPAFSQHILNTFLTEFNALSRNLVSQLATVAGKGPVDIKEFIVKYTLGSICRTSLGLDAKNQSMIDNEYAKAIDELLGITVLRTLNVALYPSFIYNWTAICKREKELIAIIDDIINPIIQKRKSDLKAINCINNDNESVTGKYKPMLDLLLHLSDEEHVFSDNEIRQHLDTFIVASYDTTTAALQNTILALGTYPNVQERVYNEVQAVFQNNDELTKHDMSRLVYLEAVIKEVLRLFNVVPWMARKLHTDVELPKYTLRAGSTCVLTLCSLHRHPAWGADVNEFKPERWLDATTLPTNPNLYAPFGIGKRNCIGRQYAMMSVKTSVAHIVRKFQISANINNVKWKYEIVLKPTKPPLVNLTLRS